MKARYAKMKKNCEEQKAEYEKTVAEKDRVINELMGSDESTVPKLMKMNNEDVFVAKPKKGAKTVQSKGCSISGCENVSVELIKCNLCGNHVCEECCGVKFLKLRPVLNQCKTLYFTCHSCDLLIRDKDDINVYDVLKGKVDTLTEELDTGDQENGELSQRVKALERQLEERENTLHQTEEKLVSLEQNGVATDPGNKDASVEDLINKRFDKIDQNIDALISKKLAGVLPIPTVDSGSTDDTRKLFSAVVGGTPGNHVTALKTSRNAELIEQKEQERRVNNIIIYGMSEEQTDVNITTKEKDQSFINDLFAAIEVEVIPKQIIRLGNETAGRNRPVKVVLRNSDDKGQIMSSLNKLKNADESLRGISVRDDYTIEERQLIKTMHEEAKRKNEADNVTHWKVRGTPKNGLRVVKVTARN